MASYNRFQQQKRRNIPRRIMLLVVVLVVVSFGSVFAVRRVYNEGLKPVSNDQTTQVVTIKKGSSSKEIGSLLASKHLIKSAWAFELYVHSKEVGDKLQAGTYALSADLGTPAIIKTLTRGDVTTKLVTIVPGKRIDQVRADLINDGFAPDAVDHALDPAQYSNVSTLAYKPAGASLEGLLYPDSFQRTADTDPSVIIRESLKEMGTHLTPDVQAGFAQQSLTVYQGLILASIVEREVSKPTDRPQVAQALLSRLRQGMPLQSDATATYGAVLAGKAPSLTFDSVYNTYNHTGLPPTPVSSVTDSSLQAVAHPANTSWLYFVSGDDGNTYFSTNLQDHQALTQKYCHKLCSQ